MKVKENGSDRTAEAHVRIEGKIESIEEFDEHVDPKDGAICCYIPVDQGDTLKIYGRFSGTSLVIAYDAVIDGVRRKASSYVSKAVQLKKSQKLDFDTFLYQTDDGVIDTSMRVAKIDMATKTCQDGSEIIGTIELRLYVTRQLSIDHYPEKPRKYSEIRSPDMTLKSTGSAKIDPQFVMEFEENCATLEPKKQTQEQKKVDSKRPGTGPWVVFRFYYRSKQSIVDQKMEMTYDPTDKSKSAHSPRLLEMESVPQLFVGTKPANNDGDSSTRASSIPPEVPSTPIKTPSRKAPTTKPTTLRAKTPSDEPSSHGSHNDPKDDIHQSPLSGRAQGGRSMMKSNGHRYRPQGISSKQLDPTVPQAKMYPPALGITTNSSIGNNIAKTGAKPQSNPASIGTRDGTSSANTTASVIGSKKPLVDLPYLSDGPTTSLFGPPNPSATSMKPLPKNTLVTTTPTLPTVPTMLTKRPADVSSTTDPDPKRLKTMQIPTMPTATPRAISASPSPHPIAIELQVAEQRKRLEAIRKEREEMAQKQKNLEQQIEPYKQRMADELEKLTREMAAEETALAEEKQRFCASTAILDEFKNNGA